VIRLPPPLRFLAAVVALWTCLRAAVLTPSWWPAPAGPTPLGPGSAAVEATAGPAALPPSARIASVRDQPEPPIREPFGADDPPRAVALATAPPAAVPPPASPPGIVFPEAAAVAPDGRAEAPALPLALAARPAARAWAVSAWTFWRRGDGGGLASGGALGGSQAGARATYRLGSAIEASFRLSSPIRRSAGAEAALGVDWRPARRLPVHLLAERR